MGEKIQVLMSFMLEAAVCVEEIRSALIFLYVNTTSAATDIFLFESVHSRSKIRLRISDEPICKII